MPATSSLGPSSSGGDILDLLGGTSSTSAPAMNSNPALNNPMDLLSSLGLGTAPTTTPTPNIMSAQPPSMMSYDFTGQGLLGDGTNGEASSILSMEGYNKNGLVINFDFSRQPGSTDLTVTMTAVYNGSTEITDFVFQAAVPKSFRLDLQPPSGNKIAAFGMGNVTQKMLIKNPNKQQLKLRLRLQYKLEGKTVSEIDDVKNIPEATWN
ncbi:AP1G1 [Bugula neritina]|uniref:AP1G1 n=1 Tax=Bugula neritina TaxID=10212 RepID=A0A7J7KBQ5_BUGNE|nr:AP1G1 [Bugula neritina]